jgi:hypothetical protein
MELSEIGGGKPHNPDQSAPKPFPEKKEVGSGEEKPKIPVTENPSEKVEEQPKRPLKRRQRGAF